MDKKKILLISPPFIPTSVDSFAGTEQMIYNLGSSLQNLGHDVYTVAREDSKINTKLVPGVFKDIEKFSGAELEYGYQSLRNNEKVVRKFIRENKNLDLIVDRCFGLGLSVSVEENGPPVICGLNMESKYFLAPRLFDDLKLDIKKRGDLFASPTNFIAEEYLKIFDFSGMEDIMSVVPNGIVTENFNFFNSPENYLMYMGRMVERKGLHHAINAATRTGHKLIVVGSNPLIDKDNQYADSVYYQEKIVPILNENIEFYGIANLKEKVKLLQNAKAVLFPSETEPFGLVPLEAMACGTPVIAFNKGGPKETILHGKTGYLANSPEELTKYLGEIDKINRIDCRNHVLNNFSYQALGIKYNELIKKLTK